MVGLVQDCLLCYRYQNILYSQMSPEFTEFYNLQIIKGWG